MPLNDLPKNHNFDFWEEELFATLKSPLIKMTLELYTLHLHNRIPLRSKYSWQWL